MNPTKIYKIKGNKKEYRGGVNLIKVHYMHVQTPFVQLIYSNKIFKQHKKRKEKIKVQSFTIKLSYVQKHCSDLIFFKEGRELSKDAGYKSIYKSCISISINKC
jgi:hypothetical protein